jgi:hypothetical protein
MKITISRPICGISINGDEDLLDEDGELLEFDTVKEAIQFFADHNFTITDLLSLDFHFEEEEEELEENPYLLTSKECEETIAAYRRWGRNWF